MEPYLTELEVQQEIGGDRVVNLSKYTRPIAASTQQIDRWTGRRFLRDPAPSERKFQAQSCDRVCVGDFTDPSAVLVETDDIGDGTWSPWEPSEWQPEADDRGNGRFVRLDGEPWRWIASTGARKFPTAGALARVRATTTWGWQITPFPVKEACMELSILHVQAKGRAPNMLDGDPIMMAKTLLMDYAVEGGTLCRDPLPP